MFRASRHDIPTHGHPIFLCLWTTILVFYTHFPCTFAYSICLHTIQVYFTQIYTSNGYRTHTYSYFKINCEIINNFDWCIASEINDLWRGARSGIDAIRRCDRTDQYIYILINAFYWFFVRIFVKLDGNCVNDQSTLVK